MRKTIRGLALAGLALGVVALLAPAASARQYEVRVINLTEGQPLTPLVAATHRGKHALYRAGRPASVGVSQIAENGNSAPLLAFLDANPFGRIGRFLETETGPLVPAGKPGAEMFRDRVKFTLRSKRRFNRLSLVSMLICTNDGFTGTNSLRLPGPVGGKVVRKTVAFDAHTEQNTEDYADIVPPCQALIGDSSSDPGTGVSDPALAEGGLISRHLGLEGIADLDPSIHGWTDPVARVKVTRIR